jgi:hypothetical protein
MSYAGEGCDVQQVTEYNGVARGMRRLIVAAVALGVAALLGGCGIFGCGGSATNGAAFGGCGAGMRF